MQNTFFTDTLNAFCRHSRVSVDGASPGTAKSFTIAASKPAGGGVIKFNFTDGSMVPPHTYAISETVKCTSAAFGAGAGPG